MRLTSLVLLLGGLTPKLYLLAPNLASGARGVGEVGDEVRERRMEGDVSAGIVGVRGER